VFVVRHDTAVKFSCCHGVQIDSWLEFGALSLSCQTEFKDALEYLNQALAPAAYLVGHSVSIADFAIWAVLHGNAL